MLQNIYLMLDLLYHKRNPHIMTIVHGSIFKNIFKTLTWKKNLRRYFLLGYYNDEIITEHHFYKEEKLFKFFFSSRMIFLNILQNVVIYLFKYFALHILVIPQNDRFLYYRPNQIFLCCIILQNAFLAP